MEKVLRYRAHLERKVRLQVCETVNRLKEEESLVRQLGGQRLEVARGQADERSKGIPVYRDQIHTFFLRQLTDRMTEAHRELEKSKERLKLLKTLLTLATAKKKSLESLRDEQLRRFTEASEMMEQKLLDEFVVIRRERQAI